MKTFNKAIAASRNWLRESGAINIGRWSHNEIRSLCHKTAVEMQHNADSHERYELMRELQQTLLHAEIYGVITWLSEGGILDYKGRETLADLRDSLEGRLSKSNQEIVGLLNSVVQHAATPQQLLEQRRARAYELLTQGVAQKTVETILADEANVRGWEPVSRTRAVRDAQLYATANGLPQPPARYRTRRSAST